jgi:hypothetical protein
MSIVTSITTRVHQADDANPRLETVVKSAAVGGVLGAALGAGLSFTALPFIGALSAPIGAAIGGAAGIVLGSIVGILRSHAGPQGAHGGAATIQAAPPAPVGGTGATPSLPPPLPTR